MIPPSRIAQLAAAGLAGGLIAGGGYALASGTSKTIHGCVNKTTRVLTVQRHCTHSQTTLNWNQRGPIGATGRTGQTGPAGPQAVGAWAVISENPSAAGVIDGQNLAVTRTGVGTISVTITGGPCATQFPAIIATPEPGAVGAGDAPVAYVMQPQQPGPFTVTFGTLHAGTFTPQDSLDRINVAVYCKPA
jgi:hypothetical protein